MVRSGEVVGVTVSLRPARGDGAAAVGAGATDVGCTTNASSGATGGGGGGGGVGARVCTHGTPALSKSAISILVISALGSAARRNDWASRTFSRRLRISRALPQPSLRDRDSIQGIRLCSSSSGN